MSTVALSFTPAAANLTGLASNATGASWPLSATSSADNLAHLITIRNDSGTDHSGKTALITGTDADGQAQTETLALPAGAGTSTSTKYFLTVTSIVPSATIGADTMDLGWSAVAWSRTVPLNWRQDQFQVSLAVVITGTISITVQHTFDYLSAIGNIQSANWLNHATLASTTATADGNYAFPAVATHLKINSVSAGATVKYYVVQGDRS
jgi:hypothetical protein